MTRGKGIFVNIFSVFLFFDISDNMLSIDESFKGRNSSKLSGREKVPTIDYFMIICDILLQYFHFPN